MIKFVCSNCGMKLDNRHHLHQDANECLSALGNHISQMEQVLEGQVRITQLQTTVLDEIRNWMRIASPIITAIQTGDHHHE